MLGISKLMLLSIALMTAPSYQTQTDTAVRHGLPPAERLLAADQSDGEKAGCFCMEVYLPVCATLPMGKRRRSPTPATRNARRRPSSTRVRVERSDSDRRRLLRAHEDALKRPVCWSLDLAQTHEPKRSQPASARAGSPPRARREASCLEAFYLGDQHQTQAQTIPLGPQALRAEVWSL